MRELARLGHPKAISWNPPQLLDHMATTDEVAYSPLIFGYTNYSRPGYRRHPVHFGNVPGGADGKTSGAILGGAGFAISSTCRHPEAAAGYAAYVCGAEVQRGMYFDHGGQPGHRAAWLDPRTNAAAADFFGNTLASLDAAAMRPRFAGWVGVQDAACDILHRFVAGDGNIEQTLDALDAAWRTARAAALAKGYL
jgi:multiple sugar transport system substrate-binding protein